MKIAASVPRRLLGACCVTAGLATQMAAPAPAHAAGVARVVFVNPETYTDARDASGRSDDNLQVLSQHLQRLAQRHLAQGQSLQIELLDVDLAGRLRPFRGGAEVRVVKGSVDAPRISLRYTLQAGGAVLQRGEESLLDLNFMSGYAGNLATEPLRYEKRMLERWFTARFVEHQAPDH